MAKPLKADGKENEIENGGLGDAMPLPDPDRLKKHFAELSKLDSKGAEIRGKIGSAVKTAEDDDNIHRAASRLVSRLSKMDPTKRAEYLTHFDHYRNVMGLDDQTSLDLTGSAATSTARQTKPKDEFDAAAPVN